MEAGRGKEKIRQRGNFDLLFLPSSERSGLPSSLGFLLLIGVIFTAVFASGGVADAGELWWVKTVAEFTHDSSAFTQGLVVHGGKIFESTGKYGKSSLRRVDIETGTVERKVSLAREYFGEGIAIFEDRLYQLTWKNHTVIIYNINTLEVLETLAYNGEAWGLTQDGTHLILSDGSASLRFLHPKTLAVEREIIVREGDTAVSRLNELEYVRGEIWANVWYRDSIVRISPNDGNVLGWIDLRNLSRLSRLGREEVLNGIAYDADSDRLFITGKNWSKLYEIKVTAP